MWLLKRKKQLTFHTRLRAAFQKHQDRHRTKEFTVEEYHKRDRDFIRIYNVGERNIQKLREEIKRINAGNRVMIKIMLVLWIWVLTFMLYEATF